MSDLKQRQAEFLEKKFAENTKNYWDGNLQFGGDQDLILKWFYEVGFDAFRSSPEYQAMKAALEWYAKQTKGPYHNDKSGNYMSIDNDGGAKAREVLKAIESEAK